MSRLENMFWGDWHIMGFGKEGEDRQLIGYVRESVIMNF